MTEQFSVNAVSKLVRNQRPGKEFTRWFKSQMNAEIYITAIDKTEEYEITEYNFTRKFTAEEVETEARRRKKLLVEATRLQDQALQRTINNRKDQHVYPCETCGKEHQNYECCSQCNYDNHMCHFCGDELGHKEVSVCYILEGLGE